MVRSEPFNDLFQRHAEPIRCETVGVSADEPVRDDYAFRLSLVAEDPEWPGSMTREEETALLTYLKPSNFHLFNRALYGA